MLPDLLSPDLLLTLAAAAPGAADAAAGAASEVASGAADAAGEVLTSGSAEPYAYAPYTSWLKAVPFVILFTVAAKLCQWADTDAEAARLPREKTGLLNLAGLSLGSLAFFLLPNFLLATAAALLIFAATAGAYLAWRNSKVGLKDLGPEFNAYLASFAGKRGPKKEKEQTADEGEIVLIDAKGTPVPRPAAEDPNRPLYLNAQRILAGPLLKGAEKVELIPGSSGSQARYVVDGVTYPGPQLDSSATASTVPYLKKLMGVDAAEKRRPQEGKMGAKVNNDKLKLAAGTSGSTKGERLRFEVDPAARYAKKLEDLGFRKSQLAAVRESVGRGTGIVLVAAPPQQGLTTDLYAFVREHDAFLQHLQTLEAERSADIEGVTQNELKADDDESERVDWLSSQQPDVIMMDRVEKPATAKFLCEFAKQKRAYVGIRATSAFDAITRWRKLVGDDKLAYSTLDMAVCGRVFRRLCPSTKVGYKPDARTLKAMGLPADKPLTLYKPQVGLAKDDKGNPIPDPFCHGLGYKGRIGAFEVVVVDDELRQALLQGAAGQQVKSLFRKAGGRYLQEMALGIVQVGETSLKEVQRVLEGKDAPKPGGAASQAPPGRQAAAAK